MKGWQTQSQNFTKIKQSIQWQFTHTLFAMIVINLTSEVVKIVQRQWTRLEKVKNLIQKSWSVRDVVQ